MTRHVLVSRFVFWSSCVFEMEFCRAMSHECFERIIDVGTNDSVVTRFSSNSLSRNAAMLLRRRVSSTRVVLTMTSLVEQTTPIAHFMSDFAESASNVIFHDEDMDLGELGGTVNWDPPATEMLVSSYRVYFATDALTKTGVQLVGHGLPGVNQMLMLAKTPLASFSALGVCTASSLAE